MGSSSVIIICVLALFGEAFAGCGSDMAGRLIGTPIKFQDRQLNPSPNAQHVPLHDRCRNTNPATGLLVKACSTYGVPTVLVTDVENAQIICPYGCVVSATDYCLFGAGNQQ